MDIHNMAHLGKPVNIQYLDQLSVSHSVIKHFNFCEMSPCNSSDAPVSTMRIEGVWKNQYINVVIMVLAKYKKAKIFVEFMSSYGSVLFLHKSLSETYGKKFDSLLDAKQYINTLIMDKQFLMQFKPSTREVLFNGDKIVWENAIIGLNIDPKKLFDKENKDAVKPVSRDT